jgi:hypothetical protein
MWKCAAHESELRTLKYPTVRTELRTFYSNSYKNSPPATNWITNIYRNNCKTYSSEKKKAIVSSAILVLELRTKRSSCRWLYNWFIRNYAVSYRVPDMLILLQFHHLSIIPLTLTQIASIPLAVERRCNKDSLHKSTSWVLLKWIGWRG